MAEKKREVKKRKENPISYFDYNLLFLVVFLVCFGLVMLYSSSSYICANSAKYNYDAASSKVSNITVFINPCLCAHC